MKTLLIIVGTIGMLIGLLWMAQGSGIFPYPSSSFMIDQSAWIAYGAVLALAGAALAWTARRR